MATKAEANYRPGSPIKCCGLCIHYQGGKCDAVAGAINPFMISDIYKPYKRPADVKGGYRDAGNGKVTQGPPEPASTRIGSKTYD